MECLMGTGEVQPIKVTIGCQSRRVWSRSARHLFRMHPSSRTRVRLHALACVCVHARASVRVPMLHARVQTHEARSRLVGCVRACVHPLSNNHTHTRMQTHTIARALVCACANLDAGWSARVAAMLSAMVFEGTFDEEASCSVLAASSREAVFGLCWVSSLSGRFKLTPALADISRVRAKTRGAVGARERNLQMERSPVAGSCGLVGSCLLASLSRPV